MKRTAMIRSKRTIINIEANQKLKKIYSERGITSCEIQEANCQGNWGLSFHHRHKRVWYYDKSDSLLSDFHQTLLCCIVCHAQLEHNKELHDYYFMMLRAGERPNE